jgi:erythritol transport system ATP-binding protein
MSSGRVVLKARGITKEYGVTKALKGVDFDIRAGKVTTLFGENGAGKSTLMKILSGVEQPTSGTLEVNGEMVKFASTNDAREKGIAIIHQELNLAPNLPVRDNIFMGREIIGRFGVDFEAERKATVAVLNRLEEPISPETLVSELRLGQQQIVEIARALSSDASILIMDEPTRGLDYQAKSILVDTLISYARNLGKCVLIATHDVELVAEAADRVVFIADGDVVADGPTIDVLLSSPAFAPQVAKVMSPAPWLTVSQALNGIAAATEGDDRR